MTGRPRILCVAPSYPWPATDGYLLRLSNTIEALQSVGDIDFVWLRWADRAIDKRTGINLIEVPAGNGVAPKPSIVDMFSSIPRRMKCAEPIDLSPVREEISGPYDLVYCSNVDIWWRAESQLPDAPTIIDFNDLLHLLRRNHRGTKRMVEALEAPKWDRLQRDAASKVAAVMVCSELDVGRSGCPNAVAANNGYELDRVPPSERPAPPPDGGTLIMVGLWSYSANSDGAEWFARQVLPLIRQARPQLRTRFVGRAVECIAGLGELDGVELVGEVADVGPELDRADISIVPIRGGGGTRLKALEAFANRVPVVSTSKGVEGIECTDGLDVLIADGAAGFAAKVLEALDDTELRGQLVDNAARLFEDRYRWSAIREGIATLARQVLDGVPVGSAGTVPHHRG